MAGGSPCITLDAAPPLLPNLPGYLGPLSALGGHRGGVWSEPRKPPPPPNALWGLTQSLRIRRGYTPTLHPKTTRVYPHPECPNPVNPPTLHPQIQVYVPAAPPYPVTPPNQGVLPSLHPQTGVYAHPQIWFYPHLHPQIQVYPTPYTPTSAYTPKPTCTPTCTPKFTSAFGPDDCSREPPHTPRGR